jgi:hypothetical protein
MRDGYGCVVQLNDAITTDQTIRRPVRADAESPSLRRTYRHSHVKQGGAEILRHREEVRLHMAC